MTEVKNTFNLIKLSGAIAEEPVFSHSLFGTDFYSSSIYVKRLSGTVDKLPLLFPESLLSENIAVGNQVKIFGQIRSYNMQTESGNRLVLNVYVISLYCDDDAVDVNEVILDGYICKPAVYRLTPFGREIADLLLAVNRAYHKSDYIPCITWGKNARICSELDVGSRVKFIGRMQSREYEKISENESVKRVAYEVSVAKMEII